MARHDSWMDRGRREMDRQTNPKIEGKEQEEEGKRWLSQGDRSSDEKMSSGCHLGICLRIYCRRFCLHHTLKSVQRHVWTS